MPAVLKETGSSEYAVGRAAGDTCRPLAGEYQPEGKEMKLYWEGGGSTMLPEYGKITRGGGIICERTILPPGSEDR